MDRGLHWVHLGVLAAAAPLPFPAAVLADAIRVPRPADLTTAMVLYSAIGTVLCASWTFFFHYLAPHQDLAEEQLEPGFFARERLRPSSASSCRSVAAPLAVLVRPAAALAIFLALPVFYGITSHGSADRRGGA